ncbi:hypothetical protein TNCV_966531 [Trichonephila clavipes]|nr:hypothetical protein TNCV_966531 [Trichonephila clavipes]
MPRGRHSVSFNQISDFDRGKILAYKDCGLSFREISQSVGRDQANCPPVPFDTVCSRVEYPEDVHCFVCPSMDIKGVFPANREMNGVHGQRNGSTWCSLKNSTSACNIMMLGLEVGDTLGRGC